LRCAVIAAGDHRFERTRAPADDQRSRPDHVLQTAKRLRARQALKSSGRVFRSESDTAVVLHGYREWGPRLVDRLRGMGVRHLGWPANTPLPTRDRLGINICASDAAVSLFASEIRCSPEADSAAAGPGGARSVPCLSDGTAPTLVEGVEMLAPGHLVEAGETASGATSPIGTCCDRRTATRRR
jgi:asparagine synthetase B (glutamine-hydrolysing)